jgi:5,10-methylenetetrahydrofolate reductase
MSFVERLGRRNFIVTSELTPPKGTDCRDALKAAEGMSKRVDAVNVTDGQSAVMRLGSLTLCHLLIDKGIEPVLQLTCRDRNRIALQSELLSAYALGIRNVLCLTGDHVALGDHPDAKQVFDLDSVSLLGAVRMLNSGVDIRGNSLSKATDFCPGAVVNPNASPVDPQLLKMEKKIRAGARFFQTQAVFDPSNLEPFLRMARENDVALLMGVLVLRTPAMGRFVNERVAGVQVPSKIIEELKNSQDPSQTGVEIAARTIKEAKDLCQGVHIMNWGKEGVMQQLLEKAGLHYGVNSYDN